MASSSNLLAFRNRASEVSRLEAFSDVVFGFALTILVVSLEVPRTFDELKEIMRGFVAFGVCFFIFLQLWFHHYTFFRRYALHDVYTFFLNAVLLFLVMFYVYPLKFLFNLVLGTGVSRQGAITVDQAPALFAIYGLGFAGVYGIFMLLYHHAYRRREILELNALEVFDTRVSMADNAMMAAIGLLSILAAYLLPVRLSGMAGTTYFLIGPAKTGLHWWAGWRRRKMVTEVAECDHPTAGLKSRTTGTI